MALLEVLADLAITGRLGPVANGAAWDTVTADLGEPWVGTMDGHLAWPRLFAYGDLELNVCRCRAITLICVQTWREVIELPLQLVGGTGAFPGEIHYADVVAALDRAGCPWQPYPPLTFDDQCSLMATPSGATFVFEIPDGSDPVLNVVGLPPHQHDCRMQAPPALEVNTTPRWPTNQFT
jgi:hypothetical protein